VKVKAEEQLVVEGAEGSGHQFGWKARQVKTDILARSNLI